MNSEMVSVRFLDGWKIGKRFRNFSPTTSEHEYTMRRDTLHNKRWVSGLLAFALLLMAFPAGASWQCVTGTPCPPDCSMLHPASASRLSCAPASAAHCARCQKAATAVTALVQPSTGKAACCCSSPCVLRTQAKPAATLRSGLRLLLPLLALPPPVAASVASTVTAAKVTYTPPLDFFPERFLRPHLGRAPPVLL